MSNQPISIMLPSFTPMVKRIIIVNTAIWVVAVLILQNFVLKEPFFYVWFGFTPYKVITEFAIWQIFSYMFLHGPGVSHILFNMLVVWLFGHELEKAWGSREFLKYYLICGVGAVVVYLPLSIYFMLTNQLESLSQPVIGASGATFGLLLAYGYLYGERIVHFMMIFPLKAKWFVTIIGAIQLVNLMNTGLGGEEAHLAHLGGLLVGYIYLRWGRFWFNKSGGGAYKVRYGRKLKLVVDNESNKGEGPKYWH